MKKVLIADDDTGIVEALSVLLESEGYSVQTTIDGARVQKEIKAFSPDVILLDIWMSGQNGHDICKKLKLKGATKHIPVIMISANQDTEMISKSCGADDFVQKPFDIDDLLTKVDHFSHASAS